MLDSLPMCSCAYCRTLRLFDGAGLEPRNMAVLGPGGPYSACMAPEATHVASAPSEPQEPATAAQESGIRIRPKLRVVKPRGPSAAERTLSLIGSDE